VQDREAVALLDDVPDMDRGRRRAARLELMSRRRCRRPLKSFPLDHFLHAQVVGSIGVPKSTHQPYRHLFFLQGSIAFTAQSDGRGLPSDHAWATIGDYPNQPCACFSAAAVFVGTPETLDLAELCRERLALLSWLARALSIALQFELPQELHAAVSRASLISIVDYLVDNAIRYTPSGEQVDVRLRSFAGGIELQVLEGHGLRVAQARPVGLASTAPRVPVGSEGRYSTDTCRLQY
jgi:hypothetical protein